MFANVSLICIIDFPVTTVTSQIYGSVYGLQFYGSGPNIQNDGSASSTPWNSDIVFYQV